MCSYFFSALSFSPDGSRIFAGRSNGIIEIYNSKDSKKTGSINGHFDAIQSIAFSPNGRYILSGSSDGSARVWDAKINRINLSYNYGSQVSLSHDSKLLAFSGSMDQDFQGNIIRIKDMVTGKNLFIYDGNVGHINGLCFSPDGHNIAVCGIKTSINRLCCITF